MSFRIRNVTEINETPRPVLIKEEPEDPPSQPIHDTELDETQPPESVTIPSTSSFSNPTITSSVKIKEEPKDKDPPLSSLTETQLEDTQLDDSEAHQADTVPSTSTFANPTITSSVKIKDEPKDDPSKPSLDSAVDTKPAPTAPGRPCCRFGIKCYRQNASHRDIEAHPGDPDYKLPDYPKPPSGTPQCPYGATCYRRNPVHFQQMSHSGSPPPPTSEDYCGKETKFEGN